MNMLGSHVCRFFLNVYASGGGIQRIGKTSSFSENLFYPKTYFKDIHISKHRRKPNADVDLLRKPCNVFLVPEWLSQCRKPGFSSMSSTVDQS